MRALLRELGAAFVGEARELLRIRTLRWLIALDDRDGVRGRRLQRVAASTSSQRDKGMSKDDATTLLLGRAVSARLAGIIVGGADRGSAAHARAAGRLWTIAIGMALHDAVRGRSRSCCRRAACSTSRGIATMFFISWYHAPMAVDGRRPRAAGAARVAAQGLVIFTMHLIGTAPSSWVVGHRLGAARRCYTAMWVPTGALVVAALCMAASRRRAFARDHARAARWQAPAYRSL